jgi:Ca-activated chloride channel family protein
MQTDNDQWYSLGWFNWSTLQSFSWENRIFLYLAAITPLLFLVRWLLRHRFNQKLPIAVTRKELKASPFNLVRFIPEFLLMIAFSLIMLALARPQRTNEKVEQYTEGIDIMIGLDISRSMEIADLQPNRLEAAKEVALNFINGRRQDRIGMVVFSGDAFSLSPLTTDYDLLRAYIREIDFDMIQNSGTAIGSAMAVITNRMRESEAKSKVCIILSDGDNNAGNIDPITAAELGAAFGITLKRMAQIGRGEFFRATDNAALKSVFEKIDEYEKAEIKQTNYKDTTDFYYVYLSWAIGLFLLWLLLKSTFISNVLQD